MRTVVLLAALGLGWAHPVSLECATDATTRLIPGREMIMQGDVTPPPAGTGLTATIIKTQKGTLAANVTVPRYFFFAARLMGGGTLTPTSSELSLTANCTVQVYQVASASTTVSHIIDIAGADKGGYVTVGFTDGSFGPGVFVVNATLPS